LRWETVCWGRVIDPLGKPLDGKGPVGRDQRCPIERPAPAIMDRAPVDVPLQTGLKVIDALVPVGRGQRELILGDRQTGKTAIAIDTILNQRGQNVICVYCAIGQRASAVAKVVANLGKGRDGVHRGGRREGNDAPGLVYVTPYAATSIAEYFMEKGPRCADRLRRSYASRPRLSRAFAAAAPSAGPRSLPRRHLLYSLANAGKGDASEQGTRRRLAHRAADHRNHGAGYLGLHPDQSDLHHGRSDLPFADACSNWECFRRSMSANPFRGWAERRSGPLIAPSPGHLKLAYSQFEELETFAKFGTRLDESTRKIIDHGQRIRACLKQAESKPVSMVEQITVLLALTAGLFDRCRSTR
jgi:F-type H+/Na+-transporting ATPase subunit alpha